MSCFRAYVSELCSNEASVKVDSFVKSLDCIVC